MRRASGKRWWMERIVDELSTGRGWLIDRSRDDIVVLDGGGQIEKRTSFGVVTQTPVKANSTCCDRLADKWVCARSSRRQEKYLPIDSVKPGAGFGLVKEHTFRGPRALRTSKLHLKTRLGRGCDVNGGEVGRSPSAEKAFTYNTREQQG